MYQFCMFSPISQESVNYELCFRLPKCYLSRGKHSDTNLWLLVALQHLKNIPLHKEVKLILKRLKGYHLGQIYYSLPVWKCSEIKWETFKS